MGLSRDDLARFSLPSLEKVWSWRLAPIGRTPETESLVNDLATRGVRVREDVGGAYWAAGFGKNPDMAALFAMLLLTNPLRSRLSEGPCQRRQCDKWFIKRRRLQKCCGRSCNAIVKNAERVRDLREREKKDRLKKVRAAQRSWRSTSTRLDWKSWVSRKAKVSTKFLTRAVNRGELRVPVKARTSAPASHLGTHTVPSPAEL